MYTYMYVFENVSVYVYTFVFCTETDKGTTNLYISAQVTIYICRATADNLVFEFAFVPLNLFRRMIL